MKFLKKKKKKKKSRLPHKQPTVKTSLSRENENRGKGGASRKVHPIRKSRRPGSRQRKEEQSSQQYWCLKGKGDSAVKPKTRRKKKPKPWGEKGGKRVPGYKPEVKMIK